MLPLQLFFITTAFAGFITDKFVSDESGAPVAELTLGTPPQKYRALLDTGSSVPMFVVDFNDDVYAGYNFDSHNSSTFEGTDHYGEVIYGAGYYTGNWSYDVGSWDDKPFNITFIDSETPNSPILGIDPRINDTNILIQLQKQGVIDQKVFSIYYDDLLELTGSYVVGGIDHSKFVGELVPVGIDYLKVNNFSLSDSDDGKVANYTEDVGLFFDTGGIYAMLPDNIEEEIYLKYGDGRTVDCKAIKSAKPVVTATVGGAFTLSLHIEDYIGNCDSYTELKYVTSFSYNSPQEDAGPSLFKNAYIVWDYEKNRVLLADRNPNPGSPDIRLLDT